MKLFGWLGPAIISAYKLLQLMRGSKHQAVWLVLIGLFGSFRPWEMALVVYGFATKVSIEAAKI